MDDSFRVFGIGGECLLPAKLKVGFRQSVGFLGVSAKGRYVSKAELEPRHLPESYVEGLGAVAQEQIFVLAKIASINGKHLNTLKAIFAQPRATTLEWARIESLLLGAGCTLIEDNGSRVNLPMAQQ